MALTFCESITDRTGRELVQHGTVSFPIACYHDDIVKMAVPWHWHEELEAAILTEGRATVRIGQDKRVFQAGEGFFVNSGILHGAWMADTDVCRFHSLVFHPRLVGGSLDSVFYQNYILPITENPTLEWMLLSPDVPWQQEAMDSISQAWGTIVREEPGFEFHARAALSRLVWQLWQHIPQKQQAPTVKSIRDAERTKAMLSCIHRSYGEELTIRTIAAAASVSESECLRCFRTTIGTTPIQYLKQYRIQQAALQLSQTQDKIAEIAERCGFQDMSYFTRTFRELKGLTPTQFRRSDRGLE